MAKVRRVTAVAAIIIHDVFLDRYLPDEAAARVMRGVRDSSLLVSAIESPFQTWAGKDLHADVFDQAAALLRSMIKNHPFHDGNKRTAVILTIVFLQINGYRVDFPTQKLLRLALDIARGHGDSISVTRIKRHLRKYTKQAKSQGRGLLERFIPTDMFRWLNRDTATKYIDD